MESGSDASRSTFLILEKVGLKQRGINFAFNSPQYKAAQWLLYEDPAEIPVPTSSTPTDEEYRYLVRYGVCCLACGAQLFSLLAVSSHFFSAMYWLFCTIP